MSMSTLNVWAVLVAAIAAFVLGALWYSPAVFGKPWQKANNFGPGEPAKAGGLGMLIAFLLTLVMSVNLAMFLNDPKTTLAWGATAGFLAGFGWVAMAFGVITIFEKKPVSYALLHGGYFTVALVIMGAILGGWR